MKRLAIILSLCTIFVLSVKAQQQSKLYVNKQAPMEHWSGLLRLVETIPIPTEGYIDHLSYDLKNQHLFISGENNKKLVVVDMKAGKVIHETPLGGNPRRPFFDPASNELWVDNGDNTAIEIVDTKAAKLVGSIKMDGNDPAGIILDRAANRLYVGMGDVVNGESVVKVIDTNKRAVIAEWPITGGPQPHTAGIDAAHHRLFMGSRLGGGHVVDPGKFVVINTDTGKVVQALDAAGGADEIFYDAPTSRVYFSGSSGALVVFHEDDPDHFRLLGKVPTGAIAKSGMWIPEMKRYYSAVPKHLVQLMPTTQYGVGDWVTEESHLMVFEE